MPRGPRNPQQHHRTREVAEKREERGSLVRVSEVEPCSFAYEARCDSPSTRPGRTARPDVIEIFPQRASAVSHNSYCAACERSMGNEPVCRQAGTSARFSHKISFEKRH
jgi:hypothetical protein